LTLPEVTTLPQRPADVRVARARLGYSPLEPLIMRGRAL
jgi:hypothetical protein